MSSLISMFFVFAFLSVDLTSGRGWYGGLMGLSPRDYYCQGDGEYCWKNSHCCSKYCINSVCGACQETGEPCVENIYHACCGFCIDSACKSCKDDGFWCAFNEDCCSGYCIHLTCGSCVPDGGMCSWYGNCCSGRCIDSTCVRNNYCNL